MSAIDTMSMLSDIIALGATPSQILFAINYFLCYRSELNNAEGQEKSGRNSALFKYSIGLKLPESWNCCLAKRQGRILHRREFPYTAPSTGLSIDVSSPSVGNSLTQAFSDTPEGRWLAHNASTFGFIIRFPQGKENITGYQYEPWHIRCVGQTAAREIASGSYTLEEYTAYHKQSY